MAVSKIWRWKLDMHVGPKFLLPPMIYNLSWTPKVRGIIMPSLQVLVQYKLLNIPALSWYIVSFEICIPAWSSWCLLGLGELSMWSCTIKMDEENPTCTGLTQENRFWLSITAQVTVARRAPAEKSVINMI